MASDKSTHKENEYYDSGEEDGVGLSVPPKGTKTTRDVQSYRSAPKRPRVEGGDSGAMDIDESEKKEGGAGDDGKDDGTSTAESHNAAAL